MGKWTIPSKSSMVGCQASRWTQQGVVKHEPRQKRCMGHKQQLSCTGIYHDIRLHDDHGRRGSTVRICGTVLIMVPIPLEWLDCCHGKTAFTTSRQVQSAIGYKTTATRQGLAVHSALAQCIALHTGPDS